MPRDDVRGADPTARILAVAVVRAGRAGVHRIEAEVLRPMGLSYSGYRMLNLLWLLGPHEPRELARIMGVSVPSITSLVNTLERQSLVNRHRSAVDGRLVIVSITDGGVEVARAAQLGADRVEAAAASALSREEQKTMLAFLDRYLAAIGEAWREKSDLVEARNEFRERYIAAATGEAPRNAQEAALAGSPRSDSQPLGTGQRS